MDNRNERQLIDWESPVRDFVLGNDGMRSRSLVVLAAISALSGENAIGDVVVIRDIPVSLPELGQNQEPDISGDGVVWTNIGDRNHNIIYRNIRTMDPPRQLSDVAEGEFALAPRIDGSIVVWLEWLALGITCEEAYIFGLSRSCIDWEDEPWTLSPPSVRNGITAWWRVGPPTWVPEVLVYNLWDGEILGILRYPGSEATYSPRLGGDLLVYRFHTEPYFEVYGWRVSTRGPPFLIAAGPGNHLAPDTDGNTVVWIDHDNNGSQLFSYEVITRRTRLLSSTTGSMVSPSVSGDWVVWNEYRNGVYSISLFDLAEGQEYLLAAGPTGLTTPTVDGNNVVYTSDGQIRLLTVQRSEGP